MFCVNCGTKKKDEARFCGQCGSGFSEYQPQHKMHSDQPQKSETDFVSELPPTFQSTSFNEQTFAHLGDDTVKQPKKRRGLAIVAACFFVAVLGVGGFFGFRLLASPSLAVSRAMNNASGEVSQRLATTPLQAFELLVGSLENGTINVGFDYANVWNNWWTGETEVENYSGHFSLTSNARTNDMALRGSLQIYDIPNISFSAYINPERVAVGSPNLSDDYFGFRFDSFRRDFTSFARALGLRDNEVDMVSDIVEEIGASLARGDNVGDELEPYIEAFTRFLLDAESGSERGQEIRVGFETVTTRRVDYVITMPNFTGLLHEWISILENDETIRPMFETPMYTAMMGYDVLDEMIRELRRGVREIEDSLRGHVTLSFYIGRSNRLVQIALRSSLTLDGESISFRVAMNFGNYATDRWTMTGSVTNAWGTESFSAHWDIERVGPNHVNTWQIEYDDGDIYSVISNWNPASGDFTFSFEEETRWGNWDEEIFSGNFTVSGETFRLEIDHVDDWSDSVLNLRIYTTTDTNAGSDVRFINIDRWYEELLEMLENMFMDMFW